MSFNESHPGNEEYLVPEESVQFGLNLSHLFEMHSEDVAEHGGVRILDLTNSLLRYPRDIEHPIVRVRAEKHPGSIFPSIEMQTIKSPDQTFKRVYTFRQRQGYLRTAEDLERTADVLNTLLPVRVLEERADAEYQKRHPKAAKRIMKWLGLSPILDPDNRKD